MEDSRKNIVSSTQNAEENAAMQIWPGKNFRTKYLKIFILGQNF